MKTMLLPSIKPVLLRRLSAGRKRVGTSPPVAGKASNSAGRTTPSPPVLARPLIGLLRSMRPHHWVKNAFVFAPMFFGGQASDLGVGFHVALVFLLFSFMASSIYLINDLIDREKDRIHPVKRSRPIASGAVSGSAALAASAALATPALVASWLITPQLTLVLAIYAAMNATYTVKLKHVVILDTIVVALGFVLRVIAGGVAVEIQPSSWLLIATFLLSLFLALAKRRHELTLLEQDSKNHRPVLDEYTPELLDRLIGVVTPVTLIAYLMYTLDANIMAQFDSEWLYFTGIFVIFGIFRYLYLIYRRNLGGAPTTLLFKDGPLLLAMSLWVLAFAAIIYR